MVEFVRSWFFGLVKSKKGTLIIGAFLLGAVLLILTLGGNEKEIKSGEQTLGEYRQELEKSLEDFCSDVDGVGKCRVMITFEEGATYEYKSGSLVSEKPPKVKGITVLCHGADSDNVKLHLSEMLSGLFEIGKNRICVLKLSS